MTSDQKQHIGDGAYISFPDGYQLLLSTNRGRFDDDEVYLEPSTFLNMLEFAAKQPTFAGIIKKVAGTL